jgi:hypothetical protein
MMEERFGWGRQSGSAALKCGHLELWVIELVSDGNRQNKFIETTSQIYLKFPLTLPLSPTGERGRVRGKMLEENSQI